MESRPLGSSGVVLSRVGLGGFELGPEPGDEPDVDRAVHVIETAIEAGVNWLDTSDGIRTIAERLGASVAQVAIAWVLHQPGVSAAIVGSRNSGHMRDNAAAAALDLTGSLEEVEQLIPLGPGFAS